MMYTGKNMESLAQETHGQILFINTLYPLRSLVKSTINWATTGKILNTTATTKKSTNTLALINSLLQKGAKTFLNHSTQL